MSQCTLCCSSDPKRIWQHHGHNLFHCTSCDVIFVYPQPPQQVIRRFYLDGYHDWMVRWHSNPDDLSKDEVAELQALRVKGALCFRMIERLHPLPGSLLDVGCTAGFFLEEAQSAGWRVEGVEINPATALIAAERLDCQIHKGSVEELSLVGRRFDAVTAWDVLEHIPNPRRLLTQAAEALNPGGLLGLSTPNHAGLFPRISLAVASLTGIWPHPEPPYHLFQFSIASVSWILDRHGFELVSLRHASMDWRHTFGVPREIMTDPKRALYFLAFILPALLGPSLKRGDMLYVIARKKTAHP